MRFSDKTKRRLVVLGAVSALAVGALALPALADNATDEATEAPSEDSSDLDTRFGDRHEAFVEALAEELNLPVDQVTDAITAARERLSEQWEDERLAQLREHLDEAVANGDLTQEQADAIIAAHDAGVLPRGPGFGMRGPELRHGFGHLDMERSPMRPGFPPDAPESGTEANGA